MNDDIGFCSSHQSQPFCEIHEAEGPIGSFFLLFAVTHCYFVKLRLANDHSHGAVFCHLAFPTRRDYLELFCRFAGTEIEKCLENSRDVSNIFIYFLVTILKSSFHISPPVSYFLVMGIQTNGFSCSLQDFDPLDGSICCGTQLVRS